MCVSSRLNFSRKVEICYVFFNVHHTVEHEWMADKQKLFGKLCVSYGNVVMDPEMKNSISVSNTSYDVPCIHKKYLRAYSNKVNVVMKNKKPM